MRFVAGDLIISKKLTTSIWYNSEQTARPELSAGPLIKESVLMVVDVFDDFYRDIKSSEPLSDMIVVMKLDDDNKIVDGLVATNYKIFSKI